MKMIIIEEILLSSQIRMYPYEGILINDWANHYANHELDEHGYKDL